MKLNELSDTTQGFLSILGLGLFFTYPLLALLLCYVVYVITEEINK